MGRIQNAIKALRGDLEPPGPAPVSEVERASSPPPFFATREQRLGLTDNNDPVKIERDLMVHLPKKEWIDYSHRMIHHGRQVCKSRKPLCDACSMQSFVPVSEWPLKSSR